MKATSLKGLSVINVTTAEKIGVIEDLDFDPQSGQVTAFHIRQHQTKVTQLIPIQQVQNLGHDALTVQETSGAVAAPAQGDSTQVSLFHFVNHQKMVTENGDLLGLVKEVDLDPTRLYVTGYEVSMGGLFTKTITIPVNPAIQFGSELAVVPHTLIQAGDQQHYTT